MIQNVGIRVWNGDSDMDNRTYRNEVGCVTLEKIFQSMFIVHTEYLVWFFSSEYKKCLHSMFAHFNRFQSDRVYLFHLEALDWKKGEDGVCCHQVVYSLNYKFLRFNKRNGRNLSIENGIRNLFYSAGNSVRNAISFQIKKNIDKRFVTQMHCVNGWIHVCVWMVFTSSGMCCDFIHFVCGWSFVYANCEIYYRCIFKYRMFNSRFINRNHFSVCNSCCLLYHNRSRMRCLACHAILHCWK